MGGRKQGTPGTMPVADKTHAGKIVEQLMRSFKPLAEPIDPFSVRPHLNDYFDRVRHPMDLTTIEASNDIEKHAQPIRVLQRKLKINYYDTTDDFMKDVARIWENVEVSVDPLAS